MRASRIVIVGVGLLLVIGVVVLIVWAAPWLVGPDGAGVALASEESSADRDDAKEGEDEEDWKPPVPRGATQRVAERKAMVSRQIAASPDGRSPVKSKQVLEAMRMVPRHAFVPEDLADDAYADTPLPIGHGQTISQPYMVGYMTELLDLTPKQKVLEIGTGSGYQAAVLAQLTPHVYTIEIIKPLSERATKVLKDEGYKHVKTKHADGYHGWAEHGPYDAIIVTCAAGHLPPPLWKQLKPGGRIVIPIGGVYEVQRLVMVTKTEDGKRRSQSIMAVRFVPMTRDEQ